MCGKKEYDKNRYLENRLAFLQRNAQWKKEHVEQQKEYGRKYYLEHKKERNNRNNKRRKKDIQYKLKCYLRTRINLSLKNNFKSATTEELLGCSIQKLKRHLERQFTEGMSWNNYGKWHRDEIIPCAKFDLRKPSEQRKCFNWRNMQPLWAKDNLSKGTKSLESGSFREFAF